MKAKRMVKMKSEFFRIALVGLFAAAAVGCDRQSERRYDVERSSAKYRDAMAQYQAGNLAAALEGFEKVVQDDPLNASARFQLACLKQDSAKDYLGAMVEFREYLRFARESDKAGIAEAKLKNCRALFVAQCAAEAAANDASINRAGAEAVAKLQEENAQLTSQLEKSRKDAETLGKEIASLRLMLKGVGAGEDCENDRPVKPVLDDAALLDEGDADSESQKASVDAALAALLKDEVAQEDEAAPLSREKPVKPAKPEPSASVATPARPATYTVQDGDTLIAIAKRYYNNDASKWRAIRDANKSTISMDGRVRAGMVIKLP